MTLWDSDARRDQWVESVEECNQWRVDGIIGSMIYLLEEGDYEDCEVVAAFEGPEGLDLTMEAFYQSLGVRSPPKYSYVFAHPVSTDEERERCVLARKEYEEDRRMWNDEREAALKEAGFFRDEDRGRREWLDKHPDLKRVDYELL